MKNPAVSSSSEALALLEVESISRGILVTDLLVKKAPVQLLRAEAVTPGKYLILFAGGVAEVEESMAEGAAAAAEKLVDKLYLPYAHKELLPAIQGSLPRRSIDSVGVVETLTVASCLLSADAALKAAEVHLAKMELARGIGGKGYYALSGPLHQVEAALLAAAATVEPGCLVGTELIAAPHGDLARHAL